MQLATLIISSLSLACSAGCLCILIKGAKEMQATKSKMESDVADVKKKTNGALAKVRTALDGLEL